MDIISSINERELSFVAQREYLAGLLRRLEGKASSMQVMKDTAERFEKAFSNALRNLYDGEDVVIDPIESVDLTPVLQAIGEGDWGDEALRIEQRYDDIIAKAKLPTSRKVRIVIFDTGKQVHSRLDDIRDDTHGKNWTTSPDELDRHSHSTHCAGIVSGTDTEQRRSPIADAGMLELAWQKVLSDSGSGSFTGIRDAILHENEISKIKIAEGYFVIYSFSLGGGSAIYKPVEDTLEQAQDIGVLTVASAGNSGSTMGYPGTSDFTLGIGALQQGTPPTRASFSAYGSKLWGTTPGAGILSTIPGDKFGYKSGTSMSCPYMAYVASVVACLNPNAKWHDVVGHIVKYGSDLGTKGRDDEYGFGWPPIDALIDNPVGSHPPVEPPPPAPEPEPPILLDPKEGEFVEIDPKVSWIAEKNSTYYYVLFENESGSKNAYGTNATSVIYRQVAPGKYKWKVRGRNIDGVYGSYSEERTFVIKGDETPTPATPAPAPATPTPATPVPSTPTPSAPAPTPPPTPKHEVEVSTGELRVVYYVGSTVESFDIDLKVTLDLAKYDGNVIEDTIEYFTKNTFRLKNGLDLINASTTILDGYKGHMETEYIGFKILSARVSDDNVTIDLN